MLQARLGDDYKTQADQLLAIGRLAELRAHNSGAKLLTMIDKMGQAKTVRPAIRSQLATKMFQDKGEEMDRRLDLIHVVRDEAHSASRARSLQRLQTRF